MDCEQERAPFGYPSEVRIRSRRRYLAVQNNGRRIHTRHFIVFILPGKTNNVRIGITASRRIGNAVVRNRWKRVVRESFRHIQQTIDGPLDMVFVARRGVQCPSIQQVNEDIQHALRKWWNVPR